MSVRSIALLLALALVGLSGCAEEATRQAAEGTDAALQPSDDGNETQAGDVADGAEDASSQAVTALEALLAVDTVNGTAPLLANFTVDALGAVNASAVSWNLDFGDGEAADGTGLPAVVNHTYDVGTYVASLQVFEGEQTAATALNVTAVEGYVSGVYVTTETIAAEGMIVTGTQGDGFVFGGCGIMDDFDIAEHDFVIPAESDGNAVRVSAFRIHMDIGTTNLDSDVYLIDPEGNQIGGSGDFNAIPVLGSGSPTEDIDIQGDWAAGTYTIVVRACTGIAMEYEILGEADLVTA